MTAVAVAPLTAGVAVGDVVESTVVADLTRTQIVQYAGASGDFNPLHTDEVFATRVAGFPTVFAHGMLTMGLTGRVLTALVGPAGLRSFGARFRAQVWPGDTLTTRVTVTAVGRDGTGEVTAELELETRNTQGAVVLSGTATVVVGG